MNAILLLLPFLTADQTKPVIRLDEVTIEGKIRKPNVEELESSKLQSRTEEIALSSLIRLEKELLKPGKTP